MCSKKVQGLERVGSRKVFCKRCHARMGGLEWHYVIFLEKERSVEGSQTVTGSSVETA